MKSLFPFVVYALCCTLLGCDTIYTLRSPSVCINADSSLAQCLRVEGISSVFPDLKHIYIDSKTQTIDTNILIILFTKIRDLLLFKTFVNNNSDKSTAFIKANINSKQVNGYLIRIPATSPKNIPLQNISIFRDGLWMVFYEDKSSQLLDIILEFKRMGVNEIPKVSIEPIK